MAQWKIDYQMPFTKWAFATKFTTNNPFHILNK